MGNVLVINECHLQKTPDGKYWSNGIVDYELLSRYLDVFDEVLVAVRVVKVEVKSRDYTSLCSGKHIKILPLPDFYGSFDFLRNRKKINRMIRKYCGLADCAVIKAPSSMSFQFLKYIRGKMPYAIEVTGDPWMWMAPGEYRSLFRPFIRIVWTNQLKIYCMKANGVLYVTKHGLQKRYPCRAMTEGKSETYFTSSCSDVSIGNQRMYEPKMYENKSCFRLIHVANAINTYSKGHKEAIDIVKKLNMQGLDVRIDFIGDGNLRKEFEQYAARRNISQKVHFAGRKNSREDIFKAFREADLFLFPTHSEGLPRVVIESMSVGTPCVSTDVGGISELIGSDCLAAPGDVRKMYEIVRRLLMDHKRLTRLGEECMEKAEEYRESVLRGRRNAFYQRVERLCRTEAGYQAAGNRKNDKSRDDEQI